MIFILTVSEILTSSRLSGPTSRVRASLSSTDCEDGYLICAGGDGGLAILLLSLMRLAGRAALNLTLVLIAGRGPEK